MLKILNQQNLWRHILSMLGFGFLSFILGFIKFHIPGLEGGGTDMREIGILISVIFLPNWIYMLGVSFIASINIPFNNLEVSTILMHITSGLFAWLYYHHICKKASSIAWLGGLWVSMVLAYYTIFLIPTLVIVFYLYRVIDASEIIATYKNVLYAYRFELFASTAISGLFLGLFKTANVLRNKNKELENALIKSEESDKLKTAFLNNINHEIRTPLNAITGFTKLMANSELTDEQRILYSKVIQSSSNQLIEIINNILDLSRIKVGSIKIKKERIAIKELMDDIYNTYLPIANEKGLLLEVNPSARNPDDFIVTDRKVLNQILENLLNNAFKFTNNGFVRLRYSFSANLVLFEIEDSGPGIEKDLHDKIFEHFSKFDLKNGTLHEGTGLGLAISKALVELLGGTIKVFSESGKGSVFSFSIPSGE